MTSPKNYTPQQALQQIRHYCAYQERCHQEVKNRLYEMGMHRAEVDEIIASLITENFLNEERFAKAFAGGKFRMKQWGKRKIVSALKQKQVSEYCIRKGLAEIDGEEYEAVIRKLAEKKYRGLKSEQYLRRQFKTKQYLLSRGFEPELADEAIKSILNG